MLKLDMVSSFIKDSLWYKFQSNAATFLDFNKDGKMTAGQCILQVQRDKTKDLLYSCTTEQRHFCKDSFPMCHFFASTFLNSFFCNKPDVTLHVLCNECLPYIFSTGSQIMWCNTPLGSVSYPFVFLYLSLFYLSIPLSFISISFCLPLLLLLKLGFLAHL